MKPKVLFVLIIVAALSACVAIAPDPCPDRDGGIGACPTAPHPDSAPKTA